MTRIALISDTHNQLDVQAYKYFEECDQIWHAGDIGTIRLCREIEKHKPLVAVYGNIDGQDIRKEYPKNNRFNCENVDVLITHIGGSPGKYPPDIKGILEKNPPQLFICGHSHILKVMFDKTYNMMFFNPGAAGNYGSHNIKTMLRFTIDKEKIKDLEVVEFGKLH